MAADGSASGLEPTNETSCYETLDSTQYKIAAAIRASIGLFSFFCCLGVVLVIVLYKKYKFFIQRLILYLAVAALVHSISYTLARVNYYTPRPIEDPYCYFGGLLKPLHSCSGAPYHLVYHIQSVCKHDFQ